LQNLVLILLCIPTVVASPHRSLIRPNITFNRVVEWKCTNGDFMSDSITAFNQSNYNCLHIKSKFDDCCSAFKSCNEEMCKR
ncbi:hypothetical protein PENTCL1PPCAC_30348, partial [Pristionchus entomophagus]